jgi:acyl transferase domain-containing protein
VDWAGFDTGYRRRRVALPTYPFERQRHWITFSATAQHGPAMVRPSNHPFLGRRLLSPGRQIEFQSEFRLSLLPIVDGHRIHGMAWVNLVVYLEMILAAATEVSGVGSFKIEELNISKALILTEERERHVSLILTPSEAGECTFEIFSLSLGKIAIDTPLWVLNASGKFKPRSADSASGSQPMSISLEELRARCSTEVAVPEFYSSLRQHGVALGPQCRQLDSIWRGPGEVLGRMKKEANTRGAQAREILPLGIIDSCFQLLLELLPPENSRDYLISGLGRFVYFGSPVGGAKWCHAVLERQDTATRELTCRLRLFAESGELVAEAARATLRHVGTDALMQRSDLGGAVGGNVSRSIARFDLDGFKTLEESAQAKILQSFLLEQLSATTGLEVSKLDGNTDLTGQVDSLVAVELKTKIESALKIEVPVAFFFEGRSLNDLAGLLLQAVQNQTLVTSELSSEDGASIAKALEEVEQLSEEEARDLVERGVEKGDGLV